MFSRSLVGYSFISCSSISQDDVSESEQALRKSKAFVRLFLINISESASYSNTLLRLSHA